MEYFTMSNTNGEYTQDQLDKFNKEFPEWAESKNHNLCGEKNKIIRAQHEFHQQVMIDALIYGLDGNRTLCIS